MFRGLARGGVVSGRRVITTTAVAVRSFHHRTHHRYGNWRPTESIEGFRGNRQPSPCSTAVVMRRPLFFVKPKWQSRAREKCSRLRKFHLVRFNQELPTCSTQQNSNPVLSCHCCRVGRNDLSCLMYAHLCSIHGILPYLRWLSLIWNSPMGRELSISDATLSTSASGTMSPAPRRRRRREKVGGLDRFAHAVRQAISLKYRGCPAYSVRRHVKTRA